MKAISKKKIAIFAVILLIFGGIAIFAFLQNSKDKISILKPHKTYEQQKPKERYFSKITGVELSQKSDENKPVFGVMVENSPDARPQSGIKDADAVFEAIAEGGITRFLLLFQQNQPDLIGPVRSVRSYYVDWAGSFNASVAHVGGSQDALARMRDGNHRDMDEFFNTNTFWRSQDRYAPHNVYTKFANLADLGAKKGWNTSNFEGFPHKNDGKLTPENQNAKNIEISMSGFYYNSQYIYNPDCNCYLRNQAGAPHIDREKGQISPKVIVAMKMNMSLAGDGYHNIYNNIGSGEAVVFQDGEAKNVFWQKDNENSALIIKDSKGERIKFNRGQIWFTAVPNSGNINWK